MGNTQGREARDHGGRRLSLAATGRVPSAGPGATPDAAGRTQRRQSRVVDPFVSIFTMGGNTADDENQPFTHKETRAEREARKREEKRILREQERERSMRLERVDGGFLVTLGTYVGPEDFNKAIVRQLIIERKMAPFWRGLNDVESSWTDAQLVAVVRGQPVPDPEAKLPADLLDPSSLTAENLNINALTVPLARTQSVASEHPSHHASGLSALRPSSSHFRSRRALAAAIGLATSRNTSQVELTTPPETHLPVDGFVNGEPLEVHLYRNASECPICFLSYPPFLNHTRCCDQPICSECFVQIKRPDPHFPEHHGEDAPDPEDQPPEMLVSEPAQCPYCQQPEFGVTYDPPPFKRGIVYESPAALAAGMSSRTSINSTGSPMGGRRRTESLSASSPLVVSTDRVRPDWATKLANQRNNLARRAAAATALHNAAFLVGNGGNEARGGFPFGRGNRRDRDSEPQNNGEAARPPTEGPPRGALDPPVAGTITSFTSVHSADDGPGSSVARGSSNRARNINELDAMMMAEAMRLSLVSEQERQNKAAREAQKAAAKEAKKQEKEEKKALEKEKKKNRRSSFYSLGFGHHSSSTNQNAVAGSSSASLSSSKATQVAPRVEVTPARIPEVDLPSIEPENNQPDQTNAKGKDVDRGPVQSSGPTESESSSCSSDLPDSASAALHEGDDEDAGSAGNEPMFNFRSLAEIVGVDIENGAMQGEGKNEQQGTAEHAEHVESHGGDDKGEPVRAVTREVVTTTTS